MVTITIHKEHVKEHIQEINDAIAIGIEKRPATLGLHASACSISLIELYLHCLGKITSGSNIKHEWFRRPNPGQKIIPLAERKIAMDFSNKEEIFSLMYDIEDNRNKLIYGKPTKSAIRDVLAAFQKLHTIVKEELQKRGEE